MLSFVRAGMHPGKWVWKRDIQPNITRINRSVKPGWHAVTKQPSCHSSFYRFRRARNRDARMPLRGEKKNASRKKKVAESTTDAPEAILR